MSALFPLLPRVTQALGVILALNCAANVWGQGLEVFLKGVVGVQVGRGAARASENGTGFIVSAEGGTLSIVTARHLFFEGRERSADDINVTFYLDKLRPYPATLLADSSKLDVAVLKVDNVPLSLVQQLPKFSLRTDSPPLSIPEALHVFGGKSQGWQVSTVTVSDTGDDDSTEGFRFNGSGIRSGFSGAPILDEHGRLVGVHLGATDNDGIYGRAMRMSKAFEVLTGRLGVTMNLLNFSGAPVPAAPAAGTEKLNSKDGLKYVWIPSGTFTMGCSPEDKECNSDEKPAHSVTITNGFWLGQTAVTGEAWHRYRLAANKPALPSGDNEGQKLNEAASEKNLPAVEMTWDEAGAFCQWSGGRLPTEAEWEYAARAGSTKNRYGVLDSIAWYGGNTGKGPHPVAGKRPNAWKLYDMLGNVLQWSSDWYAERYYDAKARNDPQGPDTGTLKALRGVSWYDNSRFARASFRNGAPPGYQNFNVGVRCVGEFP